MGIESKYGNHTITYNETNNLWYARDISDKGYQSLKAAQDAIDRAESKKKAFKRFTVLWCSDYRITKFAYGAELTVTSITEEGKWVVSDGKHHERLYDAHYICADTVENRKAVENVLSLKKQVEKIEKEIGEIEDALAPAEEPK